MMIYRLDLRAHPYRLYREGRLDGHYSNFGAAARTAYHGQRGEWSISYNGRTHRMPEILEWVANYREVAA